MYLSQGFDVAVIGGGASGLAAAISAKRADSSARVAVLEALQRVGKKLLTTGNGQCNLSNSGVLDNRYHGSSDFALNALKNGQDRLNTFFKSISVELVTDQRNRIYPYSRQASAVLDALRFESDRLGVHTECECMVKRVRKQKNGFLLLTDKGEIFSKKVIVATGGKASSSLGDTGYDIARSFGHSVTRLSPAIVQLKTDISKIRALKGIKVEATVSIIRNGREVAKNTDELLFTEYGISGPSVMQISRDAVKDDLAVIDFCPDIPYYTLVEILNERRKLCGYRDLSEFLNGFLNKRVGQTLVREINKSSVSELSDTDLKTIAKNIKSFSVQITGNKGFSSAQVTAGGIDTADINPDFESKLCKGLFFTGEILNVDGDCGGFNLLFAFNSGMIAGEHAIK